MNYKRISILLMIIAIYFCGLINVKAVTYWGTAYSDASWPSCKDAGDCIALCGYTHTFPVVDSYTSQINGYLIKSAYVYYDLGEKNFYIYYKTAEGDGTLLADLRDVKFQIYSSYKSTSEYFSNTGVCPNNLYIDNLGSDDEICFDDDGHSCVENENNTGTNFSGSSDLAFDYHNEYDKNIKIYDYFLTNYKCASFNSKYNITDSFEEVIKNYFTYEYYPNYETPAFLINDSLISVVSLQLGSAVYEMTKTCKDSIPTQSGLTDEQKKEIMVGLTYGDVEVAGKIKGALANFKNYLINGNSNAPINCNDLLPSDVLTLLKNILKYIKYFGPILVMAFTIFDLIKTVVSGENTEIKKIFIKFIKRLVAAILLYFIPILVNLLLRVFNMNISDCGALGHLIFNLYNNFL